jgi:hypothetical protein
MDDHPRRSYVGFQLGVALVVAALWLSDILSATLTGTVPSSIRELGVPVNVIHSLDLAVFLPALVLSALWLRRGEARGYTLTGVLLVKVTTLGLAVLSMLVFMVRDGQTIAVPQLSIFGAFSLVGLLLVVRFLAAIGSPSRRSTTPPSVPSGEIR